MMHAEAHPQITDHHSSCCALSPLPNKPILGSSNSEANKDMVSKILTNGGRIF